MANHFYGYINHHPISGWSWCHKVTTLVTLGATRLSNASHAQTEILHRLTSAHSEMILTGPSTNGYPLVIQESY